MEKKRKIIIHDEDNSELICLNLTEDQIKAIKWMIDKFELYLTIIEPEDDVQFEEI